MVILGLFSAAGISGLEVVDVVVSVLFSEDSEVATVMYGIQIWNSWLKILSD